MTLTIGALLLLGLIGSSWSLVLREQRALRSQMDRLHRAGAAARAATPPADARPDEVPAPVARYLRWAIRTGASIQDVRMSQIGMLRTDVHGDRWMRFEAEHLAVPAATGFVWNARVAVAPLLHVRVRDAYVDGRGSGHVSFLSAVTVGQNAGTPEMNSGALHRYLAEAVWYPAALRPSAQLRWTAVDDTRALATLTDHGVTVSLEFRFADSGEVVGIHTPARWGTFAGGYRQVPWEGHFADYTERHGLLVPTEAEVGWHLDNAWHAVWKGRITGFELRIKN